MKASTISFSSEYKLPGSGATTLITSVYGTLAVATFTIFMTLMH